MSDAVVTPEPKRHVMTPQEAMAVGSWLERRRAIDAEGNALVAAAAQRLSASGRLSFDPVKCEWVEEVKDPAQG